VTAFYYIIRVANGTPASNLTDCRATIYQCIYNHMDRCKI